MSLHLIDGPAEGHYFVKRAPLFLRAVVDETTGEKDVLDQLEDRPRAAESISVYRRTGDVGNIHVHFARSSGRQSGFYVLAAYQHMPDIEGEQLRDNTAWQTWALAQTEAPA